MSQNAGQVSRSVSTADSGDSQKSKVSVIEKSVTHLLIATKSLLETLTRWSKLHASESEVSDVYVRLGYEFNIACRAFKSVGVDTSDLGPVPDKLRTILEETLSGEPSQQYLERYLPQIREIIVNLLQGLKKKQGKLRASLREAEKDGDTPSTSTPAPQAARQSSSASTFSSVGSDDADKRQNDRLRDGNRQSNEDTADYDASRHYSNSANIINQSAVPQRTSSGRATQQVTATANGPTRKVVDGPYKPMPQPSDTPQSRPPAYPPNPVDQEPAYPAEESLQNRPRPGDAFARLQRGGELERRASRRFSAYQISKHLGSTASGVPMIPPHQNSPVPNRGRDLRESMNAVRTRGTLSDRRGTSKNTYVSDASPNRQHARPGVIAEGTSTPSSNTPTFELPADRSPVGESIARSSDEKLGTASIDKKALGDPVAEIQTTGSGRDAVVRIKSPTQESFDAQPERAPSAQTVLRQLPPKYASPTPDVSSDRSSDRSSQSKELTLFLQYKARIKKYVLSEGYEELSVPRLQLAFIEKFAWNTHSNGVDLPEIYIQEPVSGVRHELEDLSDVKNRSVLVLNVDAVDEMRKHVDDGLGGLKTLLQDVNTAMKDQSSVLQRMNDGQQDFRKDIARLADKPTQAPLISSPQTRGQAFGGGSSSQLSELQTLRRDLAVMKQTYTSWTTDMKKSIADVRIKADTVKDLASKPTFTRPSDTSVSAGRAHVLSSRKDLNATSESLMTRVEELQDTVEDLRKDVVMRGVRPRARQLEEVSKEMLSTTRELRKMQDYVKKEKPTWQKIWREELQTVYDEQNELTYQEDLAKDLEGDLEAASDTFKLVEEATKQQNLVNGDGKSGTATPTLPVAGRTPSRTLNVSPAPDPRLAKDSVLGEVKALQPNHETRLEAIERAERNRRRELDERQGGEFKRELGNFVDEGRLKKSGGVEEAERVRKVKDERARRLNWERVNGIPVDESAGNDPSAPEEQDLDDDDNETTKDNSASSERLSAAMQDLSSLAGAGLPPDTVGSDREDAAIAEAAKVPQPLSLDLPDTGKDFHHLSFEAEESGATTPEAQFVEASELPHVGA